MNPNVSSKDRILFLVIIIFLVWQSIAALIAINVYLIVKRSKISLKYLALSSLLITSVVLGIVISQQYNLIKFLLNSFQVNVTFWKLLIHSDYSVYSYYLIHYGLLYLLFLPLLMATVLYQIDLATTSPHARTMREMASNKLTSETQINHRKIEKILAKTKDEEHDGILLGVSLSTSKLVVMPDAYVNQIVLVLGTTGAGKTITLRRFIKRAIMKGYPLIIVDGKPSSDNVNFVSELAMQYGRNFFGFNCGNFHHYNPFSHGDYTEIKDKIITLKDHWDSDYYRTVASDYLQTEIEVLIKTGQDVNLRNITSYLDFHNLTVLLKNNPNDDLIRKVKSLEHYQREALTGLQAHLNLLANSELGQYFNPIADHTFTIEHAISSNSAVYFALPALRYPDFAKVLGKLVINDIKSVIDPKNGNTPIFLIFDEFSVFAGDQVLNLINMGRGKGLHTVLGTQGLSDMRRVDPEFEGQLLNCTNTIICHRLNHQVSAESVSKWVGTYDSYDVTTQIDLRGNLLLGSANKNKSFKIHPDDIKHGLQCGEVYYATKFQSNTEMIRIKS